MWDDIDDLLIVGESSGLKVSTSVPSTSSKNPPAPTKKRTQSTLKTLIDLSHDPPALPKKRKPRKRTSLEAFNTSLDDQSPTALTCVGSLVDPNWETIDPTPNIHVLFQLFNDRFFSSRLAGIEVCWSPKMTMCAGVCSYEGRGGLCSVRLSVPLLKLRPRKDLIQTLLDRDGHGPEFQKHMHRINEESGTKITIYHSFHDEVRLYQQHWWRCSGVCRNRPPFHGWVKRSMNRKPGPYDLWWAGHQSTCGGAFIKVREPEKVLKNGKKESSSVSSGSTTSDIRKFFSPSPKKRPQKTLQTNPTTASQQSTNMSESESSRGRPLDLVTPFEGSGRRLGHPEPKPVAAAVLAGTNSKLERLAVFDDDDDDGDLSTSSAPSASDSVSTVAPFAGAGHRLGVAVTAVTAGPQAHKRSRLLDLYSSSTSTVKNNVVNPSISSNPSTSVHSVKHTSYSNPATSVNSTSSVNSARLVNLAKSVIPTGPVDYIRSDQAETVVLTCEPVMVACPVCSIQKAKAAGFTVLSTTATRLAIGVAHYLPIINQFEGYVLWRRVYPRRLIVMGRVFLETRECKDHLERYSESDGDEIVERF